MSLVHASRFLSGQDALYKTEEEKLILYSAFVLEVAWFPRIDVHKE